MITPSRKAKIIWQCRRGMLELDLILTDFIDNRLDDLTYAQIDAFESLLTTADPLLYAWLIGTGNPVERECISIVDLIRHQYQSE